MLKLQAVVHFYLQINEANVIECYIHYVMHKHEHFFFLIFLAYLISLNLNLPVCFVTVSHALQAFSYEGSSTSGSSKGGFAKIAPSSRFFFFSFFFFFFFFFFFTGSLVGLDIFFYLGGGTPWVVTT